MDRVQINVRLPPELGESLDAKRIKLQPELGRIPSRSEVVRMAIEEYLSKQPMQGGQK